MYEIYSIELKDRDISMLFVFYFSVIVPYLLNTYLCLKLEVLTVNGRGVVASICYRIEEI
jgi:hypothetical protein